MRKLLRRLLGRDPPAPAETHAASHNGSPQQSSSSANFIPSAPTLLVNSSISLEETHIAKNDLLDTHPPHATTIPKEISGSQCQPTPLDVDHQYHAEPLSEQASRSSTNTQNRYDVRSATATTQGSGMSQVRIPHTNTDRSHRTVWASRLDAALFLKRDARPRQGKVVMVPESYPAYNLEWEDLRNWLSTRFPGCAFDEEATKVPNTDGDWYKFKTPKPLTQRDKDEIYKCRSDYHPERDE